MTSLCSYVIFVVNFGLYLTTGQVLWDQEIVLRRADDIQNHQYFNSALEDEAFQREAPQGPPGLDPLGSSDHHKMEAPPGEGGESC